MPGSTGITSAKRFEAGSMRCRIVPSSSRLTTQMLPSPTAIPPPPTSHVGIPRIGILARTSPVAGSSRTRSPVPPSSVWPLTQTLPSPTRIEFGNAEIGIVAVTRAAAWAGEGDEGPPGIGCQAISASTPYDWRSVS